MIFNDEQFFKDWLIDNDYEEYTEWDSLPYMAQRDFLVDELYEMRAETSKYKLTLIKGEYNG